MRRHTQTVLLAAVLVMTGSLGALAFGDFGNWSQAVRIEDFGPGAHPAFNHPAALDGCPFVSPDGKKFFTASDRPGGEGGLDIWVSTRDHTNDPWGEPVNLGPPINSTSADFCPTIGRDGKTFFFVSNRPGHCGATPNGDIYTARFDSALDVDSVTHLGCQVNSGADEHSPFPAGIPGEGPVLFYSSARAGGDHDIYMSPSHAGVYGAGAQVPGVNTDANDGQPNVRRDGLELFFYRTVSPGNNDIFSAARESVHDDWSSPVNLGPDVNSPASETRPSLSWDGTTLYFGSTRSGGQSDIYVTSR